MATTNELLINITYDDAKAIANFKKVADKITTQASQQEKKINDIKTTAQAKREVDEQKHLDKLRRVREVYALKEEEADKRRAAAKLRNQNSWGTQMLSSVKNIENSVVQNMGRATNVLSNFNYIIQDLPYGFRGIANNIPMVVQGFQQLNNVTGSSRASIALMLKSLAGPAGVLFAFSAITSILDVFFTKVKAVQELAKNVEELKKQFNLSSNEVQLLNLRLAASGSSFDKVSGVLTKFSDLKYAVSQGGKEGKKALEDIKTLGLAITDTPKQAFDKLTESVRNGITSSAALRKVFGDSGTEIYTSLKNIRSEQEIINKYGFNPISEESLKNIKDASDEFKVLGDVFASSFAKLASGVLGQKEGGIAGFIKMLHSTDFEGIGSSINRTIIGLKESSGALFILFGSSSFLIEKFIVNLLKLTDILLETKKFIAALAPELVRIGEALYKLDPLEQLSTRGTSLVTELEALRKTALSFGEAKGLTEFSKALKDIGEINIKNVTKVSVNFEQAILKFVKSLNDFKESKNIKSFIALNKELGTFVPVLTRLYGIFLKTLEVGQVFISTFSFIEKAFNKLTIVSKRLLYLAIFIDIFKGITSGADIFTATLYAVGKQITDIISLIPGLSNTTNMWENLILGTSKFKAELQAVLKTLQNIKAEAKTPSASQAALNAVNQKRAEFDALRDEAGNYYKQQKDEKGNLVFDDKGLPVKGEKITAGGKVTAMSAYRLALIAQQEELNKQIQTQTNDLLKSTVVFSSGVQGVLKTVYTGVGEVTDADRKKVIDEIAFIEKQLKPFNERAKSGALIGQDLETFNFLTKKLETLRNIFGGIVDGDNKEDQFSKWVQGAQEGVKAIDILGLKIKYAQEQFDAAKSPEMISYWADIINKLIEEQNNLQNLIPIITKAQQSMIAFGESTLDAFNKMSEDSELIVEKLDYLWEQFYTARGKDARNFWREQIDKLMAPVNDLPKNTNFEDAIRLGEEYAASIVELTSFEKQRLDVENATRDAIAGTIVEYTNLEENYKNSIKLIDEEIAKNKDNIEVQNKLIALKNKTTEEYNTKKGNYFVNMGTSYQDIFGDTWEKQKNRIEQLVEKGRELTSAITELSMAGINAAIEEWTKKIELENSYWSLKSENMKNAGLEQTAYYRMMEKEHNKNLKNLQEAENKAKAEGWEKEQEYKKASMAADFAMGIFKIWAESGINVWFGAAMSALLTATYGVQLATLSSLKNPFRKYFGGWVGGQGASDNQAHLLAPGEFVVNSQAAKNNARALNDMNNGRNVSEPAINIHINGNVIGNRDYVRNHLAPEIKKAIKEGYSFA